MELYTVFMWLSAALLFIGGELCIPGTFFLLSFGIGCLGAALGAYVKLSLVLQLLLFLGISITGLLIILFYFKYRHTQQKSQPYVSALEACIGKKVSIISLLPEQDAGYISLQGQLWLARWKPPFQPSIGTVVEVTEINGCHAVVKAVVHSV